MYESNGSQNMYKSNEFPVTEIDFFTKNNFWLILNEITVDSSYQFFFSKFTSEKLFKPYIQTFPDDWFLKIKNSDSNFKDKIHQNDHFVL